MNTKVTARLEDQTSGHFAASSTLFVL